MNQVIIRNERNYKPTLGDRFWAFIVRICLEVMKKLNKYKN